MGSDDVPQAPVLSDDAMLLAEISYPPYLYDAGRDPQITLKDNRRYTMRDIGKIANRVDNLKRNKFDYVGVGYKNHLYYRC